MSSIEIINKKYKEAVLGIKEEWLQNSTQDWYKYVIELPTKIQTAYLVVVLENQVFNGGFHQYFVNFYGQFAIETINALIRIGAINKAELLRSALNIVNQENYEIDVFRDKLLQRDIRSLFILDDLFRPLDELDTIYYKTNESIELLLEDYLKIS